ncbi:hypothetical protein [Nonomuraea jabiensis]|uniref:hypothetical protein n=1 Tax=Nonomuraea jabiensis TaxID=882448 RepID=UPI003D70A0EA
MEKRRALDGIPRDRVLISRALDEQLNYPQRMFGNKNKLVDVVIRLLDENESFIRLVPCRLSGSTPGSAVIVLSDQRIHLADIDMSYRPSGAVIIDHGDVRNVVLHNDRRLGVLDTADLGLSTTSGEILAHGLLRWQAEAVKLELERLSRCHERAGQSDAPDRQDLGRELVRMGFAVDVVSYSARSSPQKSDLQDRLAAIFARVMDEMGVDVTATHRQNTGDGMNVFLPQALELHTTLPRLLHAWRDHLAHDNTRYSDRMRLRMAVIHGPVGLAALGYSGPTIVEVSRMLNSESLRRAMRDHPRTDLAVLISDQLHRDTVRAGHHELSRFDFTPCQVDNKGFTTSAWLWIARCADAG